DTYAEFKSVIYAVALPYSKLS
ncbi:MAG: hypothetical protein H6Q95_128, partial [Nitrospirae bacterium]|nr:hypothetical protein [Nitrospirota bacterium]